MKEAITLIEFLLQSTNDEKELTGKYLQNANIDTITTTEELKDYIKKKKAEYKIIRGRKLKERIAEMRDIISKNKQGGFDKQKLLLAFRNLEELEEADILELGEDEKLLKEIDSFIKNDYQEPG